MQVRSVSLHFQMPKLCVFVTSSLVFFFSIRKLSMVPTRAIAEYVMVVPPHRKTVSRRCISLPVNNHCVGVRNIHNTGFQTNNSKHVELVPLPEYSCER